MAHEAINCLDVAEAAVPMTAGNWIGIHDNLRTPRAGNVPGGQASQIVMMSTWAGSVMMARLFTDPTLSLVRFKKIVLRIFLILVIPVTLLGLLLANSSGNGLSNPGFVITYFAANIGYPLMNIFWIIFFVKKIKAGKPVVQN